MAITATIRSSHARNEGACVQLAGRGVVARSGWEPLRARCRARRARFAAIAQQADSGSGDMVAQANGRRRCTSMLRTLEYSILLLPTTSSGATAPGATTACIQSQPAAGPVVIHRPWCTRTARHGGIVGHCVSAAQRAVRSQRGRKQTPVPPTRGATEAAVLVPSAFTTAHADATGQGPRRGGKFLCPRCKRR